MRCPHCQTELLRTSASGHPMLRNRGLVLREDHLIAVCPRCKGDVILNQTLSKALQNRLILFFRR